VLEIDTLFSPILHWKRLGLDILKILQYNENDLKGGADGRHR